MTIREFEQQFQEEGLIYASMGQPGFTTDLKIVEKTVEALKCPYHFYPNANGNPELLKMLAELHQVKQENLVITHGASEAMMAAMHLVDRKRSILLPEPVYPAYVKIAELLNIPIKKMAGKMDLFTLSLTDDCSIQAVVLVSPDNPTGDSMSAEYLKRVDQLCLDQGWMLFLDCSYSLYQKENYPKLMCQHLCFYSFSKTYAMPGFRIGWCMGSEELIKKVRQYVALNTVGVADFIQQGAIAALKTNPRWMKQRVIDNAEKLIHLFHRWGIECTEEPGFYCYAKVDNPYDFCIQCTRQSKVLFLPGDFFEENSHSIRICCAISEFDEMLNRLEHFLSENQRKIFKK